MYSLVGGLVPGNSGGYWLAHIGVPAVGFQTLQIFPEWLYQLALPPQWRSVLLAPHPHQHLLSPEFLNLAILTGLRWNLEVVLICISLMIKDVEHFFHVLLSHFVFLS